MTSKTHAVSRYCYGIDLRSGIASGLQLWGPEGTQRLRIHFVPDTVDPPTPMLAPDLEWATLHLRDAALPVLLDMLRHEDQVRVTMDDRAPGYVLVHTGTDPIGIPHPPPAPTVVVSSGTTTLRGTWTLDLETGTSGSGPGQDLWWEQVDAVTRRLRPQNGAQLAHLGRPDFDAVTPAVLRAADYGSAWIDGSRSEANRLTPGSVVAVRTAAGNLAKVQVLTYGYDLQLAWVTYRDGG
jgi:hypothetical protein